MKKMKFSLLAVLVILMAVATSAITKTEAAPDLDPVYYWFDASTGQYLNLHQTVAQMEAFTCAGSGLPCAKGYNGIDEDDLPVGDVQSEIEKT